VFIPSPAYGSGGTLPGGTPGSVTGSSGGGGSSYYCYTDTSLTTTNPSGGSSFTDLLEWPIQIGGTKNTTLFAPPTPNWTVKVPSATPPVGSNTNEIPICSYDRWPTQAVHFQTASTTICPTGFDVWRFYGTTNDAGTSYGSLGMTVSHVDIVNSTCNGAAPNVDVIVPNPADTSTSATPPSVFAATSSNPKLAREYPYYTGPSGTVGYGGTVYYSVLGNPTTYKDFKVSGTTCSNIYASFQAQANADVTGSNGVFATVLLSPNPANWVKPYSPYQNFVKNFVANNATDAANPGYMGWLALLKNRYSLADDLMNLNPNLGPASLPALFTHVGSTYTPRTDPMNPSSSDFDTSTADWITTWTNLRAAYAASNVPACASPYQYLHPSTSTADQIVYGACEVPTGRAAYGETSTQFNTTFPIFKGGTQNTYMAFRAGAQLKFANGTNWFNTAYKIWTSMIASEVANRANPYRVTGTPTPACFAGATPGTGIPGAANPLSAVTVSSPTVMSGSIANPNLVTVSLGGYACTACNSASSQGPYGLNATITITLATPASTSQTFKVYDSATGSWEAATDSIHPVSGIANVCSSQGPCDWYDYTIPITCPTTSTTAACLASIANTHFTIPVAFTGTPSAFYAIHTSSTASISICTGGGTCGTQSTTHWAPESIQTGRTATGIRVFGPVI
jgi:hypothetical protein